VCAQFVCFRIGHVICSTLVGHRFNGTEDWWLSSSCLQFCLRWNCYVCAWIQRYIVGSLERRLSDVIAVPCGTFMTATVLLAPFMWLTTMSQHTPFRTYYAACLVLFALFVSADTFINRILNDHELAAAAVDALNAHENDVNRCMSPPLTTAGSKMGRSFLLRYAPRSRSRRQSLAHAW
jgi:hypothetical protein